MTMVRSSLTRSSLPLVVASCALAGLSPAYAQDARSVEEIQAEVARLKESLAKEEQALAAKGGASVNAGSDRAPSSASGAAPGNTAGGNPGAGGVSSSA